MAGIKGTLKLNSQQGKSIRMKLHVYFRRLLGGNCVMVVEGENGQFPLNSRMFVLPFENDEKGSNVCSWVFRLDLERVTSCGEKEKHKKEQERKNERRRRE